MRKLIILGIFCLFVSCVTTNSDVVKESFDEADMPKCPDCSSCPDQDYMFPIVNNGDKDIVIAPKNIFWIKVKKDYFNPENNPVTMERFEQFRKDQAEQQKRGASETK